MNIATLFDGTISCPVCFHSNWTNVDSGYRCARCGYFAEVAGRLVSLLPDTLSENNQRESNAYETADEKVQAELVEYVFQKPWNYPKMMQDSYTRAAKQMAELAKPLGPNPSILFVFGGGGMESHVSGLLGDNVVLADISLNLLKLAEQRFAHHKVPQPCAFAHCDAERLPFKSRSFDLVIGFEGVHHCLVPQAALTEIWRVARKCSFIVDNLECTLTRALYRMGQSSTLEYSGVKPNRFSLGCLETMMHNAKISRYEFRPRATLPERVHKLTGDRVGRGVEVLLEGLGQSNMFTLTSYHES